MKFNKENIIKLFNLRKEKNFLIKEENQLNSELKNYLTENNVNFLKYKNIIVSIGTRNRKEFDIQMFQKEHPNINVNKYFVNKNYEVLNFTEL
jgi:hypothetical protein